MFGRSALIQGSHQLSAFSFTIRKSQLASNLFLTATITPRLSANIWLCPCRKFPPPAELPTSFFRSDNFQALIVKILHNMDHIHKKSRLNRELFDAVVQVKVGPEKTFIIHKGLLCNSAAYFKAAFEGGFKESQSQVLELPEDDPVMFSHFELWLYSGNILESHETVKDISWKVLTDLYFFGEAREIPSLQNEAIDICICKNIASRVTPTLQIKRVYENTPENSPLRRLFVDWMTYQSDPTDSEWFGDDREDRYPKQFLFDLVVSLYRKGVGATSKITDFKAVRSEYHVPHPTMSIEQGENGR